MKFIETPIQGLWIIEPRIFDDERGFFMETYHQDKFREHGITAPFVQQNRSRSKQGVIRGLHYQTAPFEQGKLVSVAHGEVFDVAVDIRPDSPTFGKWFGLALSSENHRLFYIPPGFAHGFCALSEYVDFVYSCTSIYSPQNETGIIWNDPYINVEWPIAAPSLSDKDLKLPRFQR